MSVIDRLKETLAEASVSALRDASVIVRFSTSKPSPKIKSRRLTEEVHSVHNAHDTGDVSAAAKLFPQGVFPEFHKCIQHTRRAYNKHIELTAPYVNKGERILHVRNSDKYKGEIEIFRQDLKPLVNDMISAVPRAERAFRASSAFLTGLYNEEDLKKAIVRISEPGAFVIEVNLQALPDDNDVRVPGDWSQLMQNRGMDSMRAALIDSMIESVHEALVPVHKLLKEAKQADYKKRWHQALFDNPRAAIAKIFDYDLLGEEDELIRALRTLDVVLAGPDYTAKRMALIKGIAEDLIDDLERCLAAINVELEDAGQEGIVVDMTVHEEHAPITQAQLDSLVTDEERDALQEVSDQAEEESEAEQYSNDNDEAEIEEEDNDPLAALTGMRTNVKKAEAEARRAREQEDEQDAKETRELNAQVRLRPPKGVTVVNDPVQQEEPEPPRPTLAELMGDEEEEPEQDAPTTPSIDDVAAMSVDDLLRNLI